MSTSLRPPPLTDRAKPPAAVGWRAATWPALGAAALCAALLWLSHFPAAFGPLGWVALAPWLLLVRAGLPNWQRYTIAWLAALGFFVPVLQWMRVAHDAMFWSWLGLALYCSWYFPLGLWLVRRIDRRTKWPLVLSVPVVWTALEFVRSNLAGGFAWYLLGHSQHALLPVIQVADLAGVAAVTFLVAAVNALAAEALFRVPSVRAAFAVPTADAARLRPQVVGVAAGLVAALAYGGWQLWRSEFRDGPRVALLQSNIPQGIRNARDLPGEAADRANESLYDVTIRLSLEALRPGRPDLVVWPETTFPREWPDIDPSVPDIPERTRWQSMLAFDQKYCREVGSRLRTNALLGLNSSILSATGKPRRYNSALFVPPDGVAVARYDKMHLVPFGEYIPYRETIPLLRKLAPYDYDFSVAFGERPTRFRMTALDGREFSFATLICYEDSDAPLARQYARPEGNQPPVDFLVNISNDGWFMGTSEHEEHLAVSRFRAVECRRALVRAVNMGISAVIDANGRVSDLPAETWAKSKGVEAVVTATVPIDTRLSVYAYGGDWLPIVCGVMLACGGFWPRRRQTDVRP